MTESGTNAIPGRHWRHAAIGFALAGIGTVLLYAPMVMQTYVAFQELTVLQEIATPRWAVREALHVLATGFGSWGALVSVALFGIGLRDYWRRPWLVVTLVVLPAVLTAVGLVALKQPVHPRFFFFLICFGALIVVRGAILAGSWISETARVTRWLGGPTIGTILVGVVIVANALSLGSLYRHPKQDYEGALRYVEARRGVGDMVVTAGLAAVRPYREYYGKPWEIVRTPEDVERVRSTARQVWVVYALPRYMDPELMAWIRRECRATEVFRGPLSGGEVVVCAL